MVYFVLASCIGALVVFGCARGAHLVGVRDAAGVLLLCVCVRGSRAWFSGGDKFKALPGAFQWIEQATSAPALVFVAVGSAVAVLALDLVLERRRASPALAPSVLARSALALLLAALAVHRAAEMHRGRDSALHAAAQALAEAGASPTSVAQALLVLSACVVGLWCALGGTPLRSFVPSTVCAALGACVHARVRVCALRMRRLAPAHARVGVGSDAPVFVIAAVLALQPVAMWPLVLLVHVASVELAALLERDAWRWVPAPLRACAALLLVRWAFFATGNSNSIATIRLGTVFSATTSYEPVLVAVLLLVSTYSGVLVAWLPLRSVWLAEPSVVALHASVAFLVGWCVCCAACAHAC